MFIRKTTYPQLCRFRTTTERQHAAGEEWSVFNELRHALRRLHSLPLFSLFLSTTGKFSQFTSAIEEDLLKRVVEGKLVVIQPYTDLGFDPLARVIAADGSWNLERLTEDLQTCSQGRPLYVSPRLSFPVVIYEVMVDSQPGILEARTRSSERSSNLQSRNSSTRTIPLKNFLTIVQLLSSYPPHPRPKTSFAEFLVRVCRLKDLNLGISVEVNCRCM